MLGKIQTRKKNTHERGCIEGCIEVHRDDQRPNFSVLKKKKKPQDAVEGEAKTF